MAAKEKMIKGYRVSSKKDGFRRAGREWHGTVELPADALSEEQWQQVTAEPMLVVERVDLPAGDEVDG